MKSTLTSLGFAGCLLGAVSVAHAQENNEVRLGLYAVFYHTAADNVTGRFTPPGLNADVGDVQTLYLAYLRRLSPHLTFELTGGVPPTTDTIAKGPAYVGSVPWAGQTVGTIKWLSTTALLEYNFFNEGTTVRPFVGLGVNFTHFYDREINAAGDRALGGPTSVQLQNSIGPAATVGVTYHFMPRFTATASFSTAQVTSTLETNTAGIIRRAPVSFNPHVIVAAIGYAF